MALAYTAHVDSYDPGWTATEPVIIGPLGWLVRLGASHRLLCWFSQGESFAWLQSVECSSPFSPAFGPMTRLDLSGGADGLCISASPSGAVVLIGRERVGVVDVVAWDAGTGLFSLTGTLGASTPVFISPYDGSDIYPWGGPVPVAMSETRAVCLYPVNYYDGVGYTTILGWAVLDPADPSTVLATGLYTPTSPPTDAANGVPPCGGAWVVDGRRAVLALNDRNVVMVRLEDDDTVTFGTEAGPVWNYQGSVGSLAYTGTNRHANLVGSIVTSSFLGVGTAYSIGFGADPSLALSVSTIGPVPLGSEVVPQTASPLRGSVLTFGNARLFDPAAADRSPPGLFHVSGYDYADQSLTAVQAGDNCVYGVSGTVVANGDGTHTVTPRLNALSWNPDTPPGSFILGLSLGGTG